MDNELQKLIQESIEEVLGEDWVKNKASGSVYQVNKMDPSKHQKASWKEKSGAKKEKGGAKSRQKQISFVASMGAKDLGNPQLYKLSPEKRKAHIERSLPRVLRQMGDFVSDDLATKDKGELVRAISKQIDQEIKKIQSFSYN